MISYVRLKKLFLHVPSLWKYDSFYSPAKLQTEPERLNMSLNYWKDENWQMKKSTKYNEIIFKCIFFWIYFNLFDRIVLIFQFNIYAECIISSTFERMAYMKTMSLWIVLYISINCNFNIKYQYFFILYWHVLFFILHWNFQVLYNWLKSL